jgi:hypothetical protein
MKKLILVLLTLFVSCKYDKNPEEKILPKSFNIEEKKIDSANTKSSNYSKYEDVINFKPSDTIKTLWFNFNKLDTIIYANKYSIRIQKTDSIDIRNNYYISEKVFDSINGIYSNSHRHSRAIEEYLSKGKYGDLFERDSNSIRLKLENGEWKNIIINPENEEYDNIFQYYYEQNQFYLLRTQWGEGNNYKLINSISGKINNIGGKPIFSPNGKILISIGFDIEAEYSMNGFEIYSILNGKLKKIHSFYPNGWGFLNGKWIDDNTIILKCGTFESNRFGMNYVNFYTKLTID